jgi:hypothetical protein
MKKYTQTELDRYAANREARQVMDIIRAILSRVVQS